MKKKLAVLILALLFLSGLVMAHGQLSRERPQPPGKSFAISKHGTLLALFEANGKSRFGKLVNEGFDVKYEIGTTSMSASAIGTKVSGLRARPGQPKSNMQSADAIVQTADGALEITSHFILDDTGKKLIIERRFRNVSKNRMTLQMVRDFVDPKLVVGGHPGSNPPVDLVQIAVGRITAGLFSPFAECGGSRSDCPVKPICPGGCPDQDNSDDKAQLLGGQKDIILQWPKQITLAPSQQSGAGATIQPSPANEALIVIHVILK